MTPLRLLPVAVLLALTAPCGAGAVPAGDAEAAQADPHRQLQQILARPLYQRWKLRQMRAQTTRRESTILASLRRAVESAAEWIGDVLSGWLRGLTGPNLPLPGDITNFLTILKTAAWTVLGLIVAFVAVLLILALAGRGSAGSAARVLSREQVHQALERGEALAMDGSRWLEQAGRLADERDLRGVYRALYLGLLSGLHAGGKIDFRRHRTNWTYVSRFAGPSDERDVFTGLTHLFDDVWYGRKPPADLDIESVRRRVTQLLAPAAGHD